MISYAPMFKTLDEKGISLFDLAKDCRFNSRTRAKFRKNQTVSLETITKICEYLDVPIEDVVEVVRNSNLE